MITPAEDGPTLYAIVLAAGGSSRFGSPKQLVRVNGRPLMHTVVSRVVEVAGNSTLVVLGANAAELAPLLRHSPATVVINRDWSDGLASSIRAGIASVPGSCTGAMLVLADQVAVSAEDLRRLAGAWRRQPELIVASQYAATLGAPAIFPSAYFRDLAELRGDRGASALFRRNPDRVVRLPMDSAGLDIDTPEDLLRLDPEKR
jgi:molybdenum cofactor cytidylyltransferase